MVAISKSSRLHRDSLKTPARDVLKNKIAFSLKVLKKKEKKRRRRSQRSKL